jgi:hypothetical protein
MRYDADLAVVIEPLVAGSSNIMRPKKILYKIIPKKAAGLKVSRRSQRFDFINDTST